MSANKKGRPVRREHTAPSRALPFILGILYFFAVALSSASTIKTAAMISLLALVPVVILRLRVLRERMGLPLPALFLIVLMDGVSTLYAVSGKFALYEFLKVFYSFNLALILLALAPGKGEKPGRFIAGILAVGAATSGLVSIDLLSTHIVSGLFTGILGHLTPDYTELGGVEAGVRMISVFTNPNIFAGLMGIGTLLSVSLVLSSEEKAERIAYTVVLYLNALAFLLAFSMGASLAFLAALLVYLILEKPEKRGGLMLLLAETLILTGIAAALISSTSFELWTEPRPIPLLAALAGDALLALLDYYVGRRVAQKLAGHHRTILIVLAVLLLAAAAYAVAAVRVTGSVNMDAGETLRRAAYPAEGDYTLSVKADGTVNVTITSQNREETMMHTSTRLYTGEADGAAFTVPAGSLVLYFDFTAPEGAFIESAVYDGVESGSVPLGYKLLPGFIARRIQGLFANENAIQRFVFFEDGLKIFARSPLIGSGIGAYENGLKSVQSFYYETKYAHNHYIQAMAETGIVGLLLFVGLLAVSAVSVFFALRREGSDPLVPALGALLIYMAIHAAVEVVFSHHAYLPFAHGVFTLIALTTGGAMKKPVLTDKVKNGVLIAVCGFTAVFGLLLGLNMSAQSMVEENRTYATLENAARIDKFEWTDHMTSYVYSAALQEVDSATLAKADQYAKRLETVPSNIVPYYVAQYYLVYGRTEDGFSQLEKYVTYVSSDANAWQRAFALAMEHDDGSEGYRQGVVRLADILAAWNEENMGAVALPAEYTAYIDAARA